MESSHFHLCTRVLKCRQKPYIAAGVNDEVGANLGD